ncbi:MAG: CDP-glucose 4,6-dehydratase, partial [Candidatus Latescibacteria bacterium]|nr:CDP-glucose 4,6-dehydratase [Candidatus Latescibacterota bacterium]
MLPGKYGDRRKNFSLQSQDLKNIYSGKRVLITGHTGFKGSWLGLWLHSLSAVVAGYSL